jgi:adenosylcobinamide-GDP ribazoletransferase
MDGVAGEASFGWRRQIGVALMFLTRLPGRPGGTLPGDAVARAAWAFPLAGIAVGLIAGVAGDLAHGLRLPAGAVALIALGAGLLATGALHEDGLADTADGFGGGATPARKLDIMKDSRIGSYGVLALLIVLGLRAVALARLAEGGPGALMAALVAAHALGRAGLPFMIRALPSARPEGLAASVGRPGSAAAWGAAALGLVIAWICFGFGRGTGIAVAVGLAMAAVGLLARRQIGGYTGDVLGAAEQAGETVALLAVVYGLS